MDNRSLLISNYLNYSILEAQIEKAIEYHSPLSIVKFAIKFNPKEGTLFKNIIGFIHSYLDYIPIIYEGGNSFLLFLQDMKIHTAVMTFKKLIISIKIKYGVQIDNIGITSFDESDDLNSAIERVHKLFMKSKLAHSHEIVYGTREFDYGTNADQQDIVKSIFAKEPHANIYTFYKEMPLVSEVEVTDYNEDMLTFKSAPEKLYSLKKEEFVYLEHKMIPDVMQADVLKVDIASSEVKMNNLKFLDNSPVHRKNMRIKPYRPMQAVLEFEDQFYSSGLIADISINSVLFTVKLNKIEELINKNLQSKKFELKFHLQDIGNNVTAFTVKAMIYKMFGNQIVLNIYPEQNVKTVITEYITSCQELILKELQSKYL